MNQIPSATSGGITITTVTKSGATVIGSKVTVLTMTVPASIVPDFTTITSTEAVPDVDTKVGAFVQSLSKLALAITGATGAYGSTISSYKIEVNGQTINAASGTTPNPISASGSLTITGTITDSRGRTKVKTVTITVLAYNPPTLNSATAQRSLVSGTPNDDGTYIRVNLNAAVQSLLVSAVEKNALTYLISTRAHGTTSWTLKATQTPGGVTFNSYYVITGPYPVEESFDVLVQVVDDFATSAVILTIATATIFQHWDGSSGVGIGKYRENGMLDVAGDVYSAGLRLGRENPVPVNTNLNDLTESGLWTGYSWINAPINTIGTVQVERYSDDWVNQRFIVPGVAPGIFVRSRYNGTTWGPWIDTTTPAGQVTMYAGASTPSGWLLCDGSAVSRTTYAALFSVISTLYGSGNGSTTFNLPNLKGRVPVGRDAGQTEFDVLGEAGGEKSHLLTAAESGLRGHSHQLPLAATAGVSGAADMAARGYGSNDPGFRTGDTAASPAYGSAVVGAIPAASAHNNLQPYLTLNYIIKI
jgi:microcystin-dependent protein